MSRYLSRSGWIRLVVTTGVLAYLLSTIDIRAAGAALFELSPVYLAGALMLVAFDRFLMICRWTLLIRGAGTPIRFKSAAWIFLTSSFVGSFMPAGIGGDVMRAWTLSRRTSDRGGAIASVTVDRVLGVISVLLLGVAGVASWYRRGTFASGVWVLLFGAVLVAGAVCLLWLDRIYDWTVPGRWRRGWMSAAGRLAGAMGAYRSAPVTLMVVLLLSLAVQVSRVLQAAVLAAGLGLSVPFGYFFVFMPAGLLLLQLPISISGFGAPQGVIVWLLARRGVPEAPALALSTLVVLMGIFGNLPGALLFFRERRTGGLSKD